MSNPPHAHGPDILISALAEGGGPAALLAAAERVVPSCLAVALTLTRDDVPVTVTALTGEASSSPWAARSTSPCRTSDPPRDLPD